MAIITKKQDVYTKEEMQAIIPKLNKGRYQLDVGDNDDCKISFITNRWVQREDITTD